MSEAISDAADLVRLAIDHGRRLYADVALRFPGENSLRMYHSALDHIASRLPHPDLLPSHRPREEP